ncbi:MAG TPA: hypothetical protein VFE24_08300 [Pirellulales bacterium]|jgi:hypothetical protein|nr:hypothetical protein [Pirellulales bacterium]
MLRYLLGFLAAGLLLSSVVVSADAAKPKKKAKKAAVVEGKRVTGQIQFVSDDGKTLTIGKSHKPGKGKGKANKGSKKAKSGKPQASTEIKIENFTTVDFVGFPPGADKKLQKDEYVSAILNDDGTAKSLSVSQSPFKHASKKKAKKAKA